MVPAHFQSSFKSGMSPFPVSKELGRCHLSPLDGVQTSVQSFERSGFTSPTDIAPADPPASLGSAALCARGRRKRFCGSRDFVWQPEEQVSEAPCLAESFALASGVVAASFTKSLHHIEDWSGVGEMGSDLQAGEGRTR